MSDSEDEGGAGGGTGGTGTGGGRRDNRSYKSGAPRKRPRLDKQEPTSTINNVKDEVKRMLSIVRLNTVLNSCILFVFIVC